LLGDTDVRTWLARQARRRAAARPVAGTTTEESPDAAAPIASDELRAEGISVRFGGFRALEDAGVRVRPGEVVGLIGPNGAGKTTMFNVITGIVLEQSGRVTLGEHDLSDDPPHRIARAGLSRTFQNLRLFATLSVRENVALAAVSAARYRPDAPAVDVDVLLASAGLSGAAERPARTLDYGNQRRLELARAAALAPAYLLLDEPTSGMSDRESRAMVEHVRATARLVGAGVLVIDHDLAFITRISDHVVVLAEGRVLAEGTPARVRADPAVAEAYLGRESRTG
jgi:ABC-type branched-subunit amino acid transport system ATPase component